MILGHDEKYHGNLMYSLCKGDTVRKSFTLNEERMQRYMNYVGKLAESSGQ